jgi:hypothetical protein
MKRFITTGLAVLAAVTVLGIAQAAQAGSFVAPDAWCGYSGITAGAPAMQPKATGGIVGGGQWVAFRANLARWNSSLRRWTPYASSSWKAQLVSWGFSDDSWYEYDTRRSGVPGATVFNVTQSGYYAVYYNLYWFANEATGASSDAASAVNHHDLRSGGYGSYCRY